MKRLLVWMFATYAGVLACRAHQSDEPARDGITWGPRPPARPGSSITHTRMCECMACDDATCCRGADETQQECEFDEVEQSGADDEAVVDFSSDESCGIELRSCTSSCKRKVWRVDASESCEATQPSECCG